MTTVIHPIRGDLRIPETHTSPAREGLRSPWVPVLFGGRFHVLEMPYVSTGADGSKLRVRYYVEAAAYGPAHESQLPEDVEGATYTWVENGKRFFAHCSPAEHRQFAADAQAFAFHQFAEPIAETNALIGYNAQVNSARNTAYAKHQALVKFARLVGERVHEVVVSETLGHYHRNPHADHKRQLTVAAIDRILGTWKQNSAADAAIRADHARVETEAGEVRKRLTSSDTIETRAERHQRFIRLSARGVDPLGGKEYIYTSAVTDSAITGTANLPLSTWKFDESELKTGIVRGDFTYYDGIPGNISPDRPYAVRFVRPVSPAGSAWSQDQSFRIYGGRSS